MSVLLKFLERYLICPRWVLGWYGYVVASEVVVAFVVAVDATVETLEVEVGEAFAPEFYASL